MPQTTFPLEKKEEERKYTLTDFFALWNALSEENTPLKKTAKDYLVRFLYHLAFSNEGNFHQLGSVLATQLDWLQKQNQLTQVDPLFIAAFKKDIALKANQLKQFILEECLADQIDSAVIETFITILSEHRFFHQKNQAPLNEEKRPHYKEAIAQFITEATRLQFLKKHHAKKHPKTSHAEWISAFYQKKLNALISAFSIALENNAFYLCKEYCATAIRLLNAIILLHTRAGLPIEANRRDNLYRLYAFAICEMEKKIVPNSEKTSKLKIKLAQRVIQFKRAILNKTPTDHHDLLSYEWHLIEIIGHLAIERSILGRVINAKRLLRHACKRIDVLSPHSQYLALTFQRELAIFFVSTGYLFVAQKLPIGLFDTLSFLEKGFKLIQLTNKEDHNVKIVMAQFNELLSTHYSATNNRAKAISFLIQAIKGINLHQLSEREQWRYFSRLAKLHLFSQETSHSIASWMKFFTCVESQPAIDLHDEIAKIHLVVILKGFATELKEEKNPHFDNEASDRVSTSLNRALDHFQTQRTVELHAFLTTRFQDQPSLSEELHKNSHGNKSHYYQRLLIYLHLSNHFFPELSIIAKKDDKPSLSPNSP